MTRNNIEVGIAMGSDSDLPIMEEASKCLDELGVAYELRIISAHRTPQKMIEYGEKAKERGLKVIIAGAGGAAHLPGMLASVTTLPVIGVPVALNQLDGLDSLLSIVQMPKGVPVATVSIGDAGAENAAILAAKIIGLNNKTVNTNLLSRKKKSTDTIVKSSDIGKWTK